MVPNYNEQNAVRRYLLKQLSGAEQEAFELRLLGDDELSEELEIVEDELIDEYLADQLSGDERVAFEEIFLAHPERRRKLQEGEVLKRYFDTLPRPAPDPHKSGFLPDWIYSYLPGAGGELVLSPIGAMATLLVVALVGFVAWRAFIYQSDLDKGLLALNEAYRQERPIQARLSNLDHAPFIVTRSSNEPPHVNTFERDRADRFLSDAFKEDADAETYHALGKSSLLKREIDKAIEYLEQAKKADANDAQIYADLGAAYLEKAKRELQTATPDGPAPGSGKALEDLGRSLEYLKQALELNPDLLEALFNRGLVHEEQGLYHQAEADWRAYLEKDSSSQWAVEARDRLKSVESKKAVGLEKTDDSFETFLRAYRVRDDAAAWDIYKRSHASAGNKITAALVDQFLAEDASRNTSENLQALNYLGQLEFRKVGDAYTSDLARVYSSASPQTKAVMVQARQQMQEARTLSFGSKFDAARELFLSASDRFEKAGNLPESLAAEAAIARAAVRQPDLEKAREVLTRIIPDCESKNYKWMVAQNLSVQADLNNSDNDYSEAIRNSNDSLQLFQEMEDMGSVAGVFFQLGSLYLFLNDTETSFSYLRRALAAAEMQRAPPSDIWGIHIATSLTLAAARLYRAALDYQNEALQLASLWQIPLLISRSYEYRGRTYGLLRQFDLAQQNVRLAYEQGQPLAAERNGQNMMARALLAFGDLYRAAGDSDRALTAYDESSRRYEALDSYAHYKYAAHKGKFLSYLALNNDAMAQQELEIVLGLFDKYRKKIPDERQKNFFFDREQDIYDLAIDFTYFRLGDEHRAFYYSEICRARNLRELMHHGAEVTESDSGINVRTSERAESQIVPLTLTEIQQQLPERVQIVQYAVLEKKLLIWHVTRRSGVVPKFVEVESAKLKDAVETALRQITHRDEQGSAASLKSLYNLLIEPIRDNLDPNLVLCFIPDKALHSLPFGALLSDRSGRYLVQDYRLMTSPSATVLIDSTKQASARASVKDERLLAVGNPAFDRAANPNLANLPGAKREVEQIASNYPPSSRVLVAGQATRRAVVDEIPRADVAHFAAHYEIDSRSSLSSKLLLATDPGEAAHHQRSGLSSADIYAMNLAHMRLVILAGCKTGIEQQFGGEGPVGFARSFLAAKVPVVVASLWPVDSGATSELMIAFHRFRRDKHLPTAEALMRAQQEIMARATYRHPYYWAGFTAMGGYSDF